MNNLDSAYRDCDFTYKRPIKLPCGKGCLGYPCNWGPHRGLSYLRVNCTLQERDSLPALSDRLELSSLIANLEQLILMFFIWVKNHISCYQVISLFYFISSLIYTHNQFCLMYFEYYANLEITT